MNNPYFAEMVKAAGDDQDFHYSRKLTRIGAGLGGTLAGVGGTALAVSGGHPEWAVPAAVGLGLLGAVGGGIGLGQYGVIADAARYKGDDNKFGATKIGAGVGAALGALTGISHGAYYAHTAGLPSAATIPAALGGGIIGGAISGAGVGGLVDWVRS